MPKRRIDDWSVVTAGLLCSQRRIERNIRQYRRQVRKQLLGLIQELERGICQIGGQYFPLRVPAADSAMRDYLSELIKATNQYRFTIRFWEGGRVVNRVPFWGYSATNCGLDELLNGPGIDYWGSAAAAEGQLDVYEQFAQLVRTNRELRGRGGIYGMISNGLNSSVARLLSEGNPLAEVVLTGTPEEAADCVVKELAGLMGGRYSYLEMSEDEQEARRLAYLCQFSATRVEYFGTEEHDALLEGNVSTLDAFTVKERDIFLEGDCFGLLDDYDQALLALSGAIVGEPRRLVARKLGVCANFEPELEIAVEPEHEAKVIRMPTRRSGRRRTQPLRTAASQ